METEEKNRIKHCFILYVEERPALWSLKDPNYKNSQLRKREWEVILDLLTSEFEPYPLALLKMNTVPGLKEQFANLRTSFNKARRTSQQLGLSLIHILTLPTTPYV